MVKFIQGFVTVIPLVSVVACKEKKSDVNVAGVEERQGAMLSDPLVLSHDELQVIQLVDLLLDKNSIDNSSESKESVDEALLNRLEAIALDDQFEKIAAKHLRELKEALLIMQKLHSRARENFYRFYLHHDHNLDGTLEGEEYTGFIDAIRTKLVDRIAQLKG